MRQIVLDTETTGLSPQAGNRIIEIGCVELIDRRVTGNNFHYYFNPERDSEEGALAVHGLTTAFLQDKPKFAEIAPRFVDYIAGAEVIIHNAPFDLGFLNAELARIGQSPFKDLVAKVVDTLVEAKLLHPGKRNSLDALCDRYEIANAHRTLHGALLDSMLLAEVYLAMSRGQNSLMIDVETDQVDGENPIVQAPLAPILVQRADEEEAAVHAAYLTQLKKDSKGVCLWES